MRREGGIPGTILETPEAHVDAPPGLGPLPGEVRYVRRGPHLGPPGHQLPPDLRHALRATVAERRRRQNEAAEAARRMRVQAIAAREARAVRGWHFLVMMTLMAQS